MSGLYNTAEEVVIKAIRGLGLDPIDLAASTRVNFAKIGEFIGRDAEVARRLAGTLRLDPDALASYGMPIPPFEPPAGIQQIELPFEDETVNAWSIDGASSLLVIDAGLGPEDLANRLPRNRPLELLITHGHRDHIGGIAALRGSLQQLHAPSHLHGAILVQPGDKFAAAGRQISVIDLSGHHPEAVGYRIHGFECPVIAVGDAVFARSIGGCPGPQAYRMARRTLVRALTDLPAETLLLTGHGPATTLERERTENPFLAAWLSDGDAAP